MLKRHDNNANTSRKQHSMTTRKDTEEEKDKKLQRNSISPEKSIEKTDATIIDYIMFLYTNDSTQSFLQCFSIFLSSGFVVFATLLFLTIYILSVFEECASPKTDESVSIDLLNVATVVEKYCQAISRSSFVPTKYAKIWVLNLKAWYKYLEIKQQSHAWTLATKLLPGYALKVVIDRCLKTFIAFKEQYVFLTCGFQDRVAITLNTLVPSKNADGTQKMEFEMRTIRDLSLEELVPNDAAIKSIREAGRKIMEMEVGPVEYTWEEGKEACCGYKVLQKLFCIKVYRKTFCCCGLPRFNKVWYLPNWLCGKSKKTNYCCDPILRLNRKKMGDAKKYIQDQITNVLSSIFSGNHFIGWGANMGAYETHTYHWCLTFEQPIGNMEPGKAKTILQTSNFQNRKFRILVASEEVLDLARDYDAWDVFEDKPNEDYRMYCFRRWIHLRKMGDIFKRQNGFGKKGNEAESHKRFGHTFLCSKVEVVMPKGINQKLGGEQLSLKDQIKERRSRLGQTDKEKGIIAERGQNFSHVSTGKSPRYIT